MLHSAFLKDSEEKRGTSYIFPNFETRINKKDRPNYKKD